MKKLIFAALALLNVQAVAQQYVPGGPERSATSSDPSFVIATAPVFWKKAPSCKPYESFTDWQAENAGQGTCLHAWVYAEWRDINLIDLTQTSELPPPCGRLNTENEARVCRQCLRHETRTRTYGRHEVPEKTEYQQLIEKIKDR
jgi:hypothetical protein